MFCRQKREVTLKVHYKRFADKANKKVVLIKQIRKALELKKEDL